jgi:hypothetical protein
MLPFNATIIKIIAVLAVSLFCGGYWLCNLVFDPCTQVDLWWDMRLGIYTLIILLGFWWGYLLTKGFTKAVFLVGIVFCGGDILDRFLFDINHFNYNDLLLYIFALYHLSKSYAREIATNSR